MSALIKVLAPLTAALAVGLAHAQPQPGYGPGPGMMGGPGSGYGMGPGMGSDMGPGMGPGTGPGMGYGPRGYGPGPYGGGGPGMGSGAERAFDALGLTDAQRAEANRIRDELRRKNWDLLGKAQDEQAKLRDLYAADKLDRPAIGAAYRRLAELRLQRLENTLEAQEKLETILTPEQRKQLRRWGPWWARQ